jgi:hypothetical protein
MPGNILKLPFWPTTIHSKLIKHFNLVIKVPLILFQSKSAVYGICLPDKQFKKCKLTIFAQKIKLRKRHFSIPEDKRSDSYEELQHLNWYQ